MSVRHGLLALLAETPRHGYELKSEFERRTGATLNVGQVYTTLARLERDGAVVAGEPDVHGRSVHAITVEGLDELRRWFSTPVRREDRPRDELAIKLALAVDAPDVDVPAVLQTQRTDSLRALQDYTRLRQRADESGDLAWLLVLDLMMFQTEAEVRWLDHSEARLVRARRAAAPGPAVAPARTQVRS